MNTEEAVRACDFWTTNEAETLAIGSTSNPEVAAFFEVSSKDEFDHERWTNPGKRSGWSFTIPRWISLPDRPDKGLRVENLAYQMIVEEIERRAQ